MLQKYSTNVKAKLIIDNQTGWDTRLLRTVMLKVINDNIKHEGPLQHTLRVKIVHSKKRWTGRGGYSGYAFYHSGRMRLRLPKPTDKCWHCDDGVVGFPDDEGNLIKDGKLANPQVCDKCSGTGKSDKGLKLDVYPFAHLFEHELMHCRGYKHETMGWLNRWSPEKAKRYSYLDGITVMPRIEKAKPKPTTDDRRRKQLERTDAAIGRWRTKLKRATNALRKLERQKKRIEAVLVS